MTLPDRVGTIAGFAHWVTPNCSPRKKQTPQIVSHARDVEKETDGCSLCAAPGSGALITSMHAFC